MSTDLNSRNFPNGAVLPDRGNMDACHGEGSQTDELIQAACAFMAQPSFLQLVSRIVANRLSPSAVPSGFHSLAVPVAEILRKYLSRRLVRESVAADRLGTTVKTLQNMRSAGRGLPYYRPLGEGSRAIRYDSLELELLADSRRVDCNRRRGGGEV